MYVREYALNNILAENVSGISKLVYNSYNKKNFGAVVRFGEFASVLIDLHAKLKSFLAEVGKSSYNSSSIYYLSSRVLILEDEKSFIIDNQQLGVILVGQVKEMAEYELKNEVVVYGDVYPKNDFDDTPVNILNLLHSSVRLKPFLDSMTTKDKLIIEKEFNMTFEEADRHLNSLYSEIVFSYKNSEKYKNAFIEGVKNFNKNKENRLQVVEDEKTYLKTVPFSKKYNGRTILNGSPVLFELHESIFNSVFGDFRGVTFTLGESANLIVKMTILNSSLTPSGKAILYEEVSGLFSLLLSFDDLEVLVLKYLDNLVYKKNSNKTLSDEKNVENAHNWKIPDIAVHSYHSGLVDLFKKNEKGFHLGSVKSNSDIESRICKFLTEEVVKTFSWLPESQLEAYVNRYMSYIETDKEKRLSIVNKRVEGDTEKYSAVMVVPKLNIKLNISITKKEYYSINLVGASPLSN